MSRTHVTALTLAALASAGLAAPAVASSAPAPATAAVRGTTVGHARIVLPKGWTASRNAQGLASSWCLHPAGTRACTMTYSEPSGGALVDPDVHGGFASDPRYCENTLANGPLTRGTVTRWGGRESEYRRWDIRCGRKAGPTVVQYVVPTYPASVLFAETSRANGAKIDAVMRQIVAGTTLPRQSRPVRLAENGYLRSATTVRGGLRVTIDRVVLDGRGGAYNSSPRAYAYTVPAKAVRQPLKVGRLVHLESDGRTVSSIR